jgi:hypothetical protein
MISIRGWYGVDYKFLYNFAEEASWKMVIKKGVGRSILPCISEMYINNWR